eukprot:1431233-Pleurochrysis_carterae.AAC.1
MSPYVGSVGCHLAGECARTGGRARARVCSSVCAGGRAGTCARACACARAQVHCQKSSLTFG